MKVVLFGIMVVSWLVTYRLLGGKHALAALFNVRFTAEKAVASAIALAITISAFWLFGGFSNDP